MKSSENIVDFQVGSIEALRGIDWWVVTVAGREDEQKS